MEPIEYKLTIDTSAITDIIQLIENGKVTVEEVQGKKIYIDVLGFEKELVYKVYLI